MNFANGIYVGLALGIPSGMALLIALERWLDRYAQRKSEARMASYGERACAASRRTP